MSTELKSKYKVGDSFRVHRYQDSYPIKIHIMYVLQGTYKDEVLIIYRFYGKYKQWWHQYLSKEQEIDSWKDCYHNKN